MNTFELHFGTRVIKAIYICGLISLASVCSMHCDSGTNPAPAPTIKAGVTIVTPVAGNDFGVFDSIPVKWIGNPDSIGTPTLQSFTLAFSVDTGKHWTTMKYSPATATTIDTAYSIAWTIDTSRTNPVTGISYKPVDFTNKGIVIKVQSYPRGDGSNCQTKSGFITFHL